MDPKNNHHTWCGECVHVTTEYTPYDLPLPGEIAEEICRKALKPHKVHRAISEAIAERDRLWGEILERGRAKEILEGASEEPPGLLKKDSPRGVGKPIC